MIFVTAVYANGPDSLTGGRGRGIDCYFPSLVNISKLNRPLVLYTTPERVDYTQSLLEPHFRYLRIVPYDLSEFVYYEPVVRWRMANLDSNLLSDRNYVLCLCKPYWVAQAIERKYFQNISDGSYLWIDAGLTHHALFPERFGGVELQVHPNKQRYFPDHSGSIFSPLLAERLGQICNVHDTMFVCSKPWQQPSEAINQLLYRYGWIDSPDRRIQDHLVGGVFGGKSTAFLRFFQRYQQLVQMFVTNNQVTLEEALFSAINLCCPELFNRHEFRTWHFYSPGEPNSFLTHDDRSFYKIFLDIPHARLFVSKSAMISWGA